MTCRFPEVEVDRRPDDTSPKLVSRVAAALRHSGVKEADRREFNEAISLGPLDEVVPQLREWVTVKDS